MHIYLSIMNTQWLLIYLIIGLEQEQLKLEWIIKMKYKNFATQGI